MGIESDDRNSDSRLNVRFESKPVKNEFQSEKEGRPIFEDRDFIIISVPGDSTLTSIAEVRDDHKARFPLHWAHYQNMHGDDPKLVGTPIKEWPLVTSAMAEELKALKFHTVESLATASDAQLQSFGMRVGMSGTALRSRAQSFLKVSLDESILHKQDEELAKLREENASIRRETDVKLAEMQEQMAQILAAVGAKSEPKSGRSRKVQDSEDTTQTNAEL
jgi:hypothetical protein